MEPTGPAWLPIAVFFISRGHRVFRVPFGQGPRHAAVSSRATPSRTGSMPTPWPGWPSSIPTVLRPLVLDGADEAALDRRVRACDRLTQEASLHKVRIKDLVRQLLPMTPLTGDLGAGRPGGPRALGRPSCPGQTGRARLTGLIAAASNGHQGAERADEWLAAARSPRALWRSPRRGLR